MTRRAFCRAVGLGIPVLPGALVASSTPPAPLRILSGTFYGMTLRLAEGARVVGSTVIRYCRLVAPWWAASPILTLDPQGGADVRYSLFTRPSPPFWARIARLSPSAGSLTP